MPLSEIIHDAIYCITRTYGNTKFDAIGVFMRLSYPQSTNRNHSDRVIGERKARIFGASGTGRAGPEQPTHPRPPAKCPHCIRP